MFRYKRAIFRERSMADVKIKFKTNCQWQATIYKVPQTAVGSVVDVVYVQKIQLVLLVKTSISYAVLDRVVPVWRYTSVD
jgi:hypothetical protein